MPCIHFRRRTIASTGNSSWLASFHGGRISSEVFRSSSVLASRRGRPRDHHRAEPEPAGRPRGFRAWRDLGGRIQPRPVLRDEIEALEISVLWFTKGKGDEDMAVHFFERIERETVGFVDFRRPRKFETVLPAPAELRGRDREDPLVRASTCVSGPRQRHWWKNVPFGWAIFHRPARSCHEREGRPADVDRQCRNRCGSSASL